MTMAFVSIWYENAGMLLHGDPELLSQLHLVRPSQSETQSGKHCAREAAGTAERTRAPGGESPPLKGQFLSPRYHKYTQALKPGIICGIPQC